MVGVDPPGHFLYDLRTDDQIGRYVELCAADPVCGTRTDDLTASIRRTAADMPARWLFLPIKEGNVRALSFFGFPCSRHRRSRQRSTRGSRRPRATPSVLGVVGPQQRHDPDAVRLGSVRRRSRGGRRPTARDYFSVNGTERSPNLGCAAAAFAWGGWPASRRMADRARTRRVPSGYGPGRGNSAHRRRARPLDPARGSQRGTAAVPAERQGARAA